MRKSDKKEYAVVAVIALVVMISFAIYSSRHVEIIREEPAQPTVLADTDMRVTHPKGNVIVGQTTRDEARLLFPEGVDLGKSGLFRPQDEDCLLSFSENEDLLIRVDIGISNFATFRGIKAGDSFDKVLEKYGSNFARAYDKNTPELFDALYGSDRYVVFKVENNLVKKIYIGSPASYLKN